MVIQLSKRYIGVIEGVALICGLPSDNSILLIYVCAMCRCCREGSRHNIDIKMFTLACTMYVGHLNSVRRISKPCGHSGNVKNKAFVAFSSDRWNTWQLFRRYYLCRGISSLSVTSFAVSRYSTTGRNKLSKVSTIHRYLTCRGDAIPIARITSRFSCIIAVKTCYYSEQYYLIVLNSMIRETVKYGNTVPRTGKYITTEKDCSSFKWCG